MLSSIQAKTWYVVLVCDHLLSIYYETNNNLWIDRPEVLAHCVGSGFEAVVTVQCRHGSRCPSADIIVHKTRWSKARSRALVIQNKVLSHRDLKEVYGAASTGDEQGSDSMRGDLRDRMLLSSPSSFTWREVWQFFPSPTDRDASNVRRAHSASWQLWCITTEYLFRGNG